MDVVSLRTSGVAVKTGVRGQIISRRPVLLLVVCCLVPLMALAAVLYLAAPIWLVAPVGLLALVLLARRLMELLDADDRPGTSHDFPVR